jgi:hypothetical protein
LIFIPSLSVIIIGFHYYNKHSTLSILILLLLLLLIL